MLLAMGLTAFLCVAIGIYPEPLYALLPYPVDYAPYTTTHVVTALQLLMFSALAFATMQKIGLYPPQLRSTVLDFDFSYRVLAPRLLAFAERIITATRTGLALRAQYALGRVVSYFSRHYGAHGGLSQVSASSSMATAVLAVFAVVLFYFLLR